MKPALVLLFLVCLQTAAKAQNLVSGNSLGQENELMLGLQDTANIIAIQGPTAPSGQAPTFIPTGTISIGHVQTCDSTCHPPAADKNRTRHSGTK